MKIVYDAGFLAKLKKTNVRVRNSIKRRILLFVNDPNNPQLRNHPLKKEFQGYRSIDITSDWRAIYKEIQPGNESIAYFVALGTHRELYRNN